MPVGQLITGHPVFHGDELLVLEQLHWSHRERVCELLVADDRPDRLPSSGGFVLRRRMELWIDPDARVIDVLVIATVPSGDTITMRTTIGGSSVDITVNNAASGTPQASQLLTADTGTGLVSVELELEHTTGSATTCTRDLWQIQVGVTDAVTFLDPEL